MKIEQIKIEQIKPYKKNNKIHSERQINLVAESIKEFGFKNPVLLDKDNVIIAGHCRAEASKKLGLEEVPVIYATDLTPAQVKAYRLADNKLAELAEWDFDNIKFELEELQELDFDFDADSLGFTEEELEVMDDFEVVQDFDNEEDDMISLHNKSFMHTGNMVFKIGNIKEGIPGEVGEIFETFWKQKDITAEEFIKKVVENESIF